MFLKFLKNFLLKRKLKKTLSNVKNNFSSEVIKTVGVVVDVSYFADTNSLLADLVQNGISPNHISVLIYKDKIKKTEFFLHPAFSLTDIDWNGEVQNTEANSFLNQEFDLLISYYDIEKAALLLATQHSKSKFKVGFSMIDKRLNHFMITTVAENHTVFIDELFKYLKILNKI